MTTDNEYESIGNHKRTLLIGTILKYLRKKANLTRKQLCIRVKDLTLYNYTNYETGQCAPPIETLIKLALHYNVTMDFITGMSYTTRFKDLGKDLQDALNNLTSDQLIENAERLKTLFENICFLAALLKEGVKMIEKRPELKELTTDDLIKLVYNPLYK